MDLSNLIAMTVPVQIHPERCIHFFSPRASCQKCVQFCPNHSIRIQDGAVTVENCDGCGRCIQACPHNVFEMDFSHALTLSGEGPLLIGCSKLELSDQPVLSSGCLQQYTWLQLAILVQRFGEVVLFAESNLCNKCSLDWFPEGQLMLMERYGLHEYAQHVHIIRERKIFEEYLHNHCTEHNPRREYMKNQLENIKSAAEKYTKQSISGYLEAFRDTVTPGQALAFEKTQSHALLLHELYENTHALDVSETIPLQSLANAACRFCGICEKLCPWEALAIIEEDGKAALAHHDVLCARCGVCIDICPENGLHWDHGLTIQDIASPHWRMLAEGNARTCQHCGEKFYPLTEDQVLCVICQNKNRNEL